MSDSFTIKVKRLVWFLPGLDFFEDLKHHVEVNCAWRRALFLDDPEETSTALPELTLTKDAEFLYFHFIVPSLRSLDREQILNVRKDAAWFLRGSLVRYAEKHIGESYFRLAARFQDAVIVCDE